MNILIKKKSGNRFFPSNFKSIQVFEIIFDRISCQFKYLKPFSFGFDVNFLLDDHDYINYYNIKKFNIDEIRKSTWIVINIFVCDNCDLLRELMIASKM